MYCQFAAYPEYIGRHLLQDLLTLLPQHGLDGLSEQFSKLRLIPDGEEDTCTAEDIARLAPYTYDGFGLYRPSWYDLTHKCQGRLALTLESGIWPQDNCDNVDFEYTLDLVEGRLVCSNFEPGWDIPLTGDLAELQEWLSFLSKGGQADEFGMTSTVAQAMSEQAEKVE